MILNAYAILDGFLATLRLLLAIMVIGLAYRAVRLRRPRSDKGSPEDRYYLLVLLSMLLLGINLAAWPAFYALLQSYVPQWPGVMCMYGVTRIGLGSEGPSQFLPGLVTALQVTKPLVVFASGAWFVLYLTNRRLTRSELVPRTLVLMIVFGLISVGDATLEVAYLLIPKSEKFLEAGCCVAEFEDVRSDRFEPAVLLNDEQRPWAQWAYFGLNSAIPLGLVACRFRVRGNWLALLLVVAVLSLAVNWVYLVEIAAPTILRLPYHRCAYDLLPAAPETAAGMAMFLFGAFAVGWACLVDRVGDIAAGEDVQRGVQRLLFLAAFGYLSSLILFSVEVALA